MASEVDATIHLRLSESDANDNGPRTLAATNGVVPRMGPWHCGAAERAFEEIMPTVLSQEELLTLHEYGTHAREIWTKRVERQAVAVVVSVGALTELSYIRCHGEPRHVALLAQILRELPGHAISPECTPHRLLDSHVSATVLW